MKRAAWSRIYENIFNLVLAFDDETKTVYGRDNSGRERSRAFSRYYFLTPNGNGGWKWPEPGDFTFSIDNDTPTANNRQIMWQMINDNYANGLLGNLQDPLSAQEALVSLWQERVFADYPGAARMLERQIQIRNEMKQRIEAQQQQQMQMQQQQMAQQMQLQQAQMGQQGQLAQEDLQLRAQSEQQRAAAREAEIALRAQEQQYNIAKDQIAEQEKRQQAQQIAAQEAQIRRKEYSQ
jgi:hypothetical protein